MPYVSLSDETKYMASLDTPLALEFPVNTTRYSLWVIESVEK
jgi:hypothetical protein